MARSAAGPVTQQVIELRNAMVLQGISDMIIGSPYMPTWPTPGHCCIIQVGKPVGPGPPTRQSPNASWTTDFHRRNYSLYCLISCMLFVLLVCWFGRKEKWKPTSTETHLLFLPSFITGSVLLVWPVFVVSHWLQSSHHISVTHFDEWKKS